MCLFTVNGLYSIVKRGETFHVRSVAKHDLENLRTLVPGLPEVQDSYKGSDHPFRLLLTGDQKNALVKATGESIDYPSFKSATGTRADQRGSW